MVKATLESKLRLVLSNASQVVVSTLQSELLKAL